MTVVEVVVGLPKTLGKFDSILVVVDRLTKSTHFIPVKIDYNAQQLAKVYVKHVVHCKRCPFLSSQTMLRSSHPNFGENYTMNCILNSPLAKPFILISTGSQRGLFKCWKTCLGHV